MVDLKTTRSYIRSKKATINWLTRTSTEAVKSRTDDTMTWTLDGSLPYDQEHPNWWTDPKDEMGPLFQRQLSENQPKWLNIANRAGFYAGLKSWRWNRTELSDLMPNHYFTVRYELDRDNGNRYVRTVLQAHKGEEPSRARSDTDSQHHHSDRVVPVPSTYDGQGHGHREADRDTYSRPRRDGERSGRGRGGGGRGRGQRGGRSYGGDCEQYDESRGRGGPYRRRGPPAAAVIHPAPQDVAQSNPGSWASRLSQEPVSCAS